MAPSPDIPQEPVGDPILISTKTIPPEDRLIFALDVPTPQEARGLVATLKEAVRFYKVGLELFLGAGFELVDCSWSRTSRSFSTSSSTTSPRPWRVPSASSGRARSPSRPSITTAASWKLPAAREGTSRSSP